MYASSLEDTPPLPNASGPDANPALSFIRLGSPPLLFAPAPPDLQAPPESTHRRKIDGEHQQAQGKHPETEDGQEAQQPAYA